MNKKALIYLLYISLIQVIFISLAIGQDYNASNKAFEREVNKYVANRLSSIEKETIPKERFLVTQIRLLNEEIRSRVSNVTEIKEKYFDNLEQRLKEVKQIKSRLRNTNSPVLITYVSELENRIEQTIDEGKIDYKRQKVFEDGIQLLYIAEQMVNLDPGSRIEENPQIKKQLQESKSKFINTFGEANFSTREQKTNVRSGKETVFDIFKEWKKTNSIKYEVRWTDVQIMKNKLISSGTFDEQQRMVKRELHAAAEAFNYGGYDLADRLFEETLARFESLNSVDDILYYRAESNFNLARYHKARELYLELVNKYPTSVMVPNAYSRLISIASHFNNFEELTRHYSNYSRIAVSGEEGFEDVTFTVAVAAFNAGAYEAAVLMLEKIGVKSKYYRDSKFLLAKSYAGAQNLDQAEILFKELLKEPSLEPEIKFDVLLKLGYLAYEKNEYNQVLDYLDQINPNYSYFDKVLHLYGWTFYKGELANPVKEQRDFSTAKKYLDFLISRYPESDYFLEAKSLLGYIFQSEENAQAAIHEYDYVYRSSNTKEYSDRLIAERDSVKARLKITKSLANKALESNQKDAFYKAKSVNNRLQDVYRKLSYSDVSSSSMAMKTEIKRVTDQIIELDRLYALAEEKGESELMAKIGLLKKRMIRVLRDYPMEETASVLGVNYFDEHPAARKESVVLDQNRKILEMRDDAAKGREAILKKIEDLDVEIARARNQKDYKKLINFEIQKNRFEDLLDKFDYMDTYAHGLALQESNVNLEKWSDYGAFGIANVNFALKKSKSQRISDFQSQIQKINQILNGRKELLEHKIHLITGEIDLMTRKVREQERRREQEELDRRFKESYFDTHTSEVQDSNVLPPQID